MTASSFDPVPEPDDRPATVAAAAPEAPTSTTLVPWRPRRSRWATAFRWWLGLSVATLVGVALFAFVGYGLMDFAPLHIVVSGDDPSSGITIAGLPDGAGAALAVALLFLTLLVLLLVPVIVLLVVGSVAIALVFGIGIPLVVLALTLCAVTSPIWLVGLLIWLLARRRDSHRHVGSARMAA